MANRATYEKRQRAVGLVAEVLSELSKPDSQLDVDLLCEDLGILLDRRNDVPAVVQDSSLVISEPVEPMVRLLTEIGRAEDFLYITLPRETLRLPLHHLGFSARTYRILYRYDIRSLEDLLEFSHTELSWIPHIHKASLEEVVEKLTEKGWHLSPHDRDEPLAPPPGDEWVYLTNRRALRSRLYRVRLEWFVRHAWMYWTAARPLAELGILTVGQLIECTKEDILALNWSRASYWRHNQSTRTPEAGLMATDDLLRRWHLDLKPSPQRQCSSR